MISKQFHVVGIFLVFSDTQSKELHTQKLHSVSSLNPLSDLVYLMQLLSLRFLAHNVAKNRIQVVNIKI